MKKWSLKPNGKKHKYLLLNNDTIGHVYFTDLERDSINSMINKSNFPDSSEKLPFNYIRKIDSRLSSSEITVHYKKDSDLDYHFNSTSEKNDFLEQLVSSNPNLDLEIKETTVLQSIRIQLVALLVLAAYLGWCYTSAYAMETGNHPGRDLAVVLLLASLGTDVLKWIILVVISVLGIKIYYNIKSREDIQMIDFKKR